MPNMVENTLLN